jgi:hypothetical protein
VFLGIGGREFNVDSAGNVNDFERNSDRTYMYREPAAACPFRGRRWRRLPDTVVPVDRTRALVVDADAAEARDNVVVLLVGSIGIIGIALMLTLDVLVLLAF